MKLNNRYYILRHGEALSNVRGIVSSTPENFKNPLSEKGREQIKSVAHKLINENIDLIFSSPVLRTKQTAEIVGKLLEIKPKFDKRLTELGFGILNHKSVEEFKRYFKNFKEKIEKKIPKGENYIQVSERMYNFFEEINGRYKDKNVLIVSHQAPLLLLRAKVLGHSLSESIERLEKIFEEKRITRGELIDLNENKTL